ncbi:unnamed protein product [Lampetra planeri]
MYTRQLTRASSKEEDEEGVIPQTAPGEAAPEMDHEGFGPVEQRQERDLATPPEARVVKYGEDNNHEQHGMVKTFLLQ